MNNCPHCGLELRAGLIPLKYLREGSYGEWDGVTPRYFKREIMVEVRGVYDGGLYFTCPACRGNWHRWPEGHPLRERAETYMEG